MLNKVAYKAWLKNNARSSLHGQYAEVQKLWPLQRKGPRSDLDGILGIKSKKCSGKLSSIFTEKI